MVLAVKNNKVRFVMIIAQKNGITQLLQFKKFIPILGCVHLGGVEEEVLLVDEVVEVEEGLDLVQLLPRGSDQLVAVRDEDLETVALIQRVQKRKSVNLTLYV